MPDSTTLRRVSFPYDDRDLRAAAETAQHAADVGESGNAAHWIRELLSAARPGEGEG